MNKLVLAAMAGAMAVSPLAAQDAALSPDEAAMKAHVAFLASDELKGREPGTPEYDIAARYVATQMAAAGLLPAGDNGTYLQKVPLVSAQGTEPGTMSFTRGGKATALGFGTDYSPMVSRRDADFRATGDLVFVGYGVTDPENGRDDYKGLDVKGKIVAVLYGGPPTGLQSEIRAHFGNRETKAAIAAAHGAAGILFIESDMLKKLRPFARIAAGWRARSMFWADADGKAHQVGVPMLGYLSQAGAARVFAGSKLDWAKVAAADAAGKKVATGATGARIDFEQKSKIETITSYNVVGVLPGSDPVLKDQYVALSAHLDHIGVKVDAKPGEDAINNGAMDNAMGTASMIEAAKLFQRNGTKPRRSVLFVAVTAEEKGLVGSDYFARNPTVPGGSIVADVNLDMPILTYRFQDMVSFGGDRSDLGPIIAKVLADNGLKLTPDPMPEQAVFVRSDHYSFVRAGIPSVSLETGLAGPGKAAIEDFQRHHYHQPSDEVTLPIDWGAGRLFVKVNYEIALALADVDKRPAWNKGDFFGLLYGGYGAK